MSPAIRQQGTRQAMRPERQHQIWRSEAGSRLWLSGLIAAMEHAERPEIRRQPVAPEIMVELQAQLALTALSRSCQISILRH
ncbi:transcriptional regulator [Bradyrhizobium sp. MOS003]|uniref:transcriptional regulator n=1 Tax=Bradyrhizobium sp. MOS003 TaxID=2133946 RepID=UPI001FDF8A18|nr:transcriptional regulator [Bradyrhizobium sp. MOS003]